MRYRPLGRTGLFVSELSLGTMTFGGGVGFWSQIGQVQQAETDAMLAQALEAGVNLIDTADIYSAGLSERITGQALRNLKVAREDVIVATKVYGEMGPGPNARGASRSHLVDGLKASLHRLQLDHVDLLQIHAFDPATPVEQSVRALDDLVRQGLVRYVGVSNWSAWQVVKALGVAERLGLARFESLQAYYTLAARELEREIVPMLHSEGLGLLVWSPLAGGLLSGKFAPAGPGPGPDASSPGDPGGRRPQGDGGAAVAQGRRATFDFPPVDRARASACVEAMRPMAQVRHVSVARIALAWLLHQPAVTSVIVGATRPQQLADNLASVDVRLDEAEARVLDELSRPAPEYPGWMHERHGAYRQRQLAQGVGGSVRWSGGDAAH